MNVKIGDKFTSRLGFVFCVLEIGDGWIKAQGPSMAVDTYTYKEFMGRFGGKKTRWCK